VQLTVRKAREDEVHQDIVRVPPGPRQEGGLTVGRVHKVSTKGRSIYLIVRGNDQDGDRDVLMDEVARDRLAVILAHPSTLSCTEQDRRRGDELDLSEEHRLAAKKIYAPDFVQLQ